jgi:hypothetical protein
MSPVLRRLLPLLLALQPLLVPLPAAARTIAVRAGQRLGPALAVAAAGDTVALGPGTYDESIRLPGGVVLLGAGPQRTVLTRPHGEVLLIRDAPKGTLVGQLSIRTAATGIAVAGGAPLILDCLVEDCLDFAVSVAEGSNAELTRSFLRNNQGDGLVVRSGARPLVRDCHILGNRVGLRVDGAAPRLAGCELAGNQIGVRIEGEARPVLGDRPGDGNRIHKNRRLNVENRTPVAVPARYNYWGDARCAFLRGFAGKVAYLPFMDLALADSLAACP